MVSCDFCGKTQYQVDHITVSNLRPGAAICNECVALISTGQDTPQLVPTIRLCPCCINPEYVTQLRMLHGKWLCRDCYKREYEATYGKQSKDFWVQYGLDEARPTVQQYKEQEARQ